MCIRDRMISHYLVFAADPLGLLEDIVNLSRENIHSLDFYHIIRPADQGINTGMRVSALALSLYKAGQIMGTVTDEGRPLFAQRGDDQFPNLPIRHHFPGFGVNNLKIQIIILSLIHI